MHTTRASMSVSDHKFGRMGVERNPSRVYVPLIKMLFPYKWTRSKAVQMIIRAHPGDDILSGYEEEIERLKRLRLLESLKGANATDEDSSSEEEDSDPPFKTFRKKAAKAGNTSKPDASAETPKKKKGANGSALRRTKTSYLDDIIKNGSDDSASDEDQYANPKPAENSSKLSTKHSREAESTSSPL